MARHVDKLVVLNRAALRVKYGSGGYEKVRAALRDLAESDRARGLSSRALAIDDGRSMRSLGGHVVSDPGDAVAAKEAVDAAATALTPHFLVLVGAPDVIPQQRLRNPTPDDDPDVPSDLPYGCPVGPSDDPGDFVGPTRVVGRLPDQPGATDPAYLVRLIGRARRWRSRPVAAHLPVFAVSAKVWKGSTEQSIRQLAAGSELHLSPPSGPGWARALTRRRIHFVNCHGDEADFRWYGDDGSIQPVAIDGTLLRGALARDMVVAAECCFGAAHYDPALSGQPTVAATYLREGASGVFGASTLAYGETEGTSCADLLTRFFLSAVLEGASLGRAALQARLRFVQEMGELDPYDLKTLVQFDLLGDPSVHPVKAPVPVAPPTAVAGVPVGGVTPEVAVAASPPRVAARRLALEALGGALGRTALRTLPVGRRSTRSARRLADAVGFPPPEAPAGVEPAARPIVRRYDLRPPSPAAEPVAGRVRYTVVAARPTERRRTAVVVREETGRPATYRTLHSR
jgi:Peptidase family C25